MRKTTHTAVPQTGSTFSHVPSVLLQHKCACGNHTVAGGKCTKCAEKKTNLQRKVSNQESTDKVPPVVHEVLNSPGHPLDSRTRALMEPRFGHDFSQVRVHTDAKSAESARKVNALAYTVGRDVVFGTGQFAPEKGTGQRLLAHELTHVVQQLHTPARLQRQQTGGSVSAAERVNEAAAERASFQGEKEEFDIEKRRQRIIKYSGLLKTWLKLHRTAPVEQRQEIQSAIRILESELAEALEDNIRLLKAQSTQRSSPLTSGTKTAPAIRKEMAENQADLDALRRIFSTVRKEQFVAQYKKEALENLNCMEAAYQGLGALYGTEEATQIEATVEKKAKAHRQKTKSRRRPKGINIDQIITVMETVRERGKSGPKSSAIFNHRHGRWEPALKRLILSKVNPAYPGFYFFGFSLARAFHSVILFAETWSSERPKIYWCDQNIGCQAVSDLDAFAKSMLENWQREGELKYQDWESVIWPLTPPPEASIFGEESLQQQST